MAILISNKSAEIGALGTKEELQRSIPALLPSVPKASASPSTNFLRMADDNCLASWSIRSQNIVHRVCQIIPLWFCYTVVEWQGWLVVELLLLFMKANKEASFTKKLWTWIIVMLGLVACCISYHSSLVFEDFCSIFYRRQG